MTIRYRRFGEDENEVVAKIFARAYNDLLTKGGNKPYVDVEDQAGWTKAWRPDRQALFEHFSASKNESWLAEQDGEVLGYARSILRDGIWQLTDFWVLPHKQAGGIGEVLLDRTFRSRVDSGGRVVVATTGGAAMARYIKCGLDVLSPLLEFAGPPRSTTIAADVSEEPMLDDTPTLEVLSRLDRAILGFDRTVDHKWFLAKRTGYLYRRRGEPIGYGYVAKWPGPFAARDPADLPVVLAHAETEMAKRDQEMTLIVPMVNSDAMRYLLSRGFRMNDKFMLLFMADRVRPRLDRYIMWWPGYC